MSRRSGQARGGRSRARYDKERLLAVLEAFAEEPFGARERDALLSFAEDPAQDDRALLATLYDHYDADPYKRDTGAYVRAAVLRALRPVVRSADTPLLERALLTYEFPPPGRVEGAAHLRAAALLALIEVDPGLAAFHAARLLGDVYNSPMSGEPGLTAARVLAAQEQWLPLYACLTGPEGARSEVLSECLRSLTSLPPALLPPLVERYQESEDELVLVGLFDLILAHESGPGQAEFVVGFLRETHLHDAYRYLATVIVARRHPHFLPEVMALAKTERDRRKAKALYEALSLLAGDREVDESIRALERVLER